MKHFRSLLVQGTAIAAVLISTSASADDHSSSWYGRVNLGLNELGGSDISLTGQPASSASFDGGSLFGGAIGKQFGPFRIEGEIAYRSNELSSNSLAGFRSGDDSGDFASLGLGLNLLYETNLFGSEKAVSYFGGGLVYLEEIDIDLVTTANDEVSFANNDFGFQLIAGARYEVSKTWDVFAELRYFDGGTITMDSEINSGRSVEADYSATSLVFGVGYRF